MAKQGNTKKRILELIANGSNNLTSISEKLKLAPSTVSKHLHDLEESGFIEKSDNYTKKWKYYKISANPQSISQLGNEFGIQIVNRKMQPAKTFFFVAAFLLVAVAIYAIYYQYNSATATYLPISITDPPTVPTGTQAIYINYSGMEANIGSLGNPNWVNINSSGRIDLMSLINVSQVIGSMYAKQGSTISQVMFNVSNANIEIDNITYPIYLENTQLVASVKNSKAVNFTSGILLDFSPVVTPIYYDNSTQFLMLSSLRAAMVHINSSWDSGQGRVPAIHTLDEADKYILYNSVIKIISVSAHSNGNYTSVSVALRNTGTENATIYGIDLHFNGNIYKLNISSPVTITISRGNRESYFDAMRSSMTKQFLLMHLDNMMLFANANGTLLLPSPNMSSVFLSVERSKWAHALPPMAGSGFGLMAMKASNVSNASFMHAEATEGMAKPKIFGYILRPGENVTLSFNGQLKFFNSSSAIRINNNSIYGITVATQGGIIFGNVST